MTYTAYTKRAIQRLIADCAIPPFPEIPDPPGSVTLRQVLDCLELADVTVTNEGPWSCASGVHSPTPIHHTPLEYISLQPHVTWAIRRDGRWVVSARMSPRRLVQTGSHLHDEENVSLQPLAATLGASSERIEHAKQCLDTFDESTSEYIELAWREFWKKLRGYDLPWPGQQADTLGSICRESPTSFSQETDCAASFKSVWNEVHALASYRDSGGLIDWGKTYAKATLWVVTPEGNLRKPDEYRYITGVGLRRIWRLVGAEEVALMRTVSQLEQHFHAQRRLNRPTEQQLERIAELERQFGAVTAGWTSLM